MVGAEGPLPDMVTLMRQTMTTVRGIGDSQVVSSGGNLCGRDFR